MNLTAVNNNVTPANNISLWYNPANRLQNAEGAWGQSTYYYDGVGNRSSDVNTISTPIFKRGLPTFSCRFREGINFNRSGQSPFGYAPKSKCTFINLPLI